MCPVTFLQSHTSNLKGRIALSFKVPECFKIYMYKVSKIECMVIAKLRRPKTRGSMKTKTIVVQLGHQLPENVLKLRCVRDFCNRRRWTGLVNGTFHPLLCTSAVRAVAVFMRMTIVFCTCSSRTLLLLPPLRFMTTHGMLSTSVG